MHTAATVSISIRITKQLSHILYVGRFAT